MPRYVLYQRDDCHLCDQALAVLASIRFPEPESVFIDGDVALEDTYGTRVPVLRDSRDGRELDWPFDAGQVLAWMR
ncbi:glutaredoxin family protein [Pseudoxanthomonas suwonensis]|uniref:glutaredoxin family protein n=1 Tax=Pseudoxanthomonas suwonensis TaxID=314722 RepID=UPI00048A8B03|nr:glutaredoxin family protein [Pseudoxanthomonas suwonensis]